MTTNNSINVPFTISIANGGTSLTSFANDKGIVTYDGSNLVADQYAQLDSNDIFTNTKKPAFFAYKSATTNNVTGNATSYNFICDQEIFDQASNYDAATGIFTAPLDGLYCFGAAAYSSTSQSCDEIRIWIETTRNRNAYMKIQRTWTTDVLFNNTIYEYRLLAGDTAKPGFFTYNNVSKNCNCAGGNSPISTCFWGYFLG